MNLFDELVALIAALEAAQLPYALCGGLAVAAHGAPRATKDIDLLVPRDAVDAIAAVAATLGFKFAAAPMRFRDGMEIRRISKIESGKLLVLDLLLMDDNTRHAWDARETRALAGTRLVVVGRDALIRMKASAGRPIDVADIERLTGDDR